MNKRSLSWLLCIILVMQLALAGCDSGTSEMEDQEANNVSAGDTEEAAGAEKAKIEADTDQLDPDHVTLFFNTEQDMTMETFEQLIQDGSIEDEMASSLFYIPKSDEEIFGTEDYFDGRRRLVNKITAEGMASYNDALELMKHIDPVQSNFVWASEAMYDAGEQPEFVEIMLSEQGKHIERVLMTQAEVDIYSETSDDPYVDAWLKELKLIAQLKFADEVLTYFSRVQVDALAFIQATEEYGDDEFKVRHMSLDGASYISPEVEELYFSLLDHLKYANEYYDALEESDYYYSVALVEEFIKYSEAANSQIEKARPDHLSEADMAYLSDSTAVYNDIAVHMLKLLKEAGAEQGYEISYSQPSNSIFESFGLVAFADSIPENETYKKSLKTQDIKPEKSERGMTLFGAITSVTEGVWNVGKTAVGKVADVTVATVKTVKDTGVLLTGNKKFDQYKRDISNAAAIVTGTSGNSVKIVNETIDETVDTVSNLPKKVFGENDLTKSISKATKSVMKVGLVKVKTTLKLVDKDTSLLDVPAVIMNTGADTLMQEVVAHKKEVVSQAQKMVKALVPDKYHKSVEKFAEGAEKLVDKVSDLKEYTDIVKNPNKFLKERFIKPKAEAVMNKVNEIQSKVKEKVVEKFDTMFEQTSHEEKYGDHDQLKPANKAKENIRTNEALKTSTNLNESLNDKVKQWQIDHLDNYEGLVTLKERSKAKAASINQTPENSEVMEDAPEAEESAMPEEEAEEVPEEMEAQAEPEAEAEGAEIEAELEAEPEIESEDDSSESVESDDAEESTVESSEEVVEDMTESESEQVISDSSDASTTVESDLAGTYSGYAKKVTVDGEFSSPLGEGNSRVSLTLNDGGTGQMTLEIFGTGMMDMASTLSISNPAVQSGNSISISTVDDEGSPITVSGVLTGNTLSGTIHIVTGGSNIVLDFTASK